jgi:ribose transport system ATP-binding protein
MFGEADWPFVFDRLDMNTPIASHERGTADHPPSAVSFSGVVKSFFGVKVLKGVTFDVGAGRIVGLVGENGAGKSTLMNLLGGSLQPEAGELRVNGRPYTPRNPGDARGAGIAFVHQELNLFPNLSIAENLFLTGFPRLNAVVPWIDRRTIRSRAKDLLDQVGLVHASETLVERMSAGERQLVEIAKALGAAARVLILDEPTTSLSARECERLFALMRQLRERGLAIIYISHTLGDVLGLCDDLVVLRDGEVVGSGLASEFTQDRLVSLMVGRQLNQLYPQRQPPARRDSGAGTPAPGSRPALEVSALSQPGIVRDVSFRLSGGEVLGISGLMGAGRSELARILFGLDPIRPATSVSRAAARRQSRAPHPARAGLPHRGSTTGGPLHGSVDRRQHGTGHPSPARPDTGALAGFAGIRAAVLRMREAVAFPPKARDDQAVRTLSGGNQQKVVLGKWLLAEPIVLILDEPTRGIDVGARFEIYQLIHRLADRGAGVLVISSEIEELIGICDRILVMRQGRHRGRIPAR